LAAPIRLRGQNIGSILLRQDQDEEPWSPDEVALMEEISDQIALALENARLLEETQRRAARERLVGEITTRMRESLDVETVLQTAAREMRTALDLEEAEVRIMPSALEDDET
jgi:GAF domain-containing protein